MKDRFLFGSFVAGFYYRRSRAARRVQKDVVLFEDGRLASYFSLGMQGFRALPSHAISPNHVAI